MPPPLPPISQSPSTECCKIEWHIGFTPYAHVVFYHIYKEQKRILVSLLGLSAMLNKRLDVRNSMFQQQHR